MAIETFNGLASSLRDYPMLARLEGPQDLAPLSWDQLSDLAMEIRGFLVDKVSATGGHLGVNLGVVELSIALHRVFQSPHDVLLFDTGHQAYVHKILTGRADRFGTMRQKDGLSGYPSRAESDHDWIESSHAGTAMSYADGLAKAFRLDGDVCRTVVAVVGDGAMTEGSAWEGLNNLAVSTDPVVIVLNDNGRSYDPTIGGLAQHLTALRETSYPHGGTFFENLGIAYVGPVDGHDVQETELALRQARALSRPVVVHCVTTKGKGYAPAETDEADRMHGIGVQDPATGQALKKETSWTSVFGAEMAAVGADHPSVVAITAAMLRPVGLHTFASAFPDRVFDVGIAEQHAVTSAAGLAMGGLHPVVCLYATFLNRVYDQVLLDIALHGLPATFVLDRAGITGPDGASHHGMWDTAILATVPGLRLAAPRDPARLREELREAIALRCPTAIRFPKAGVGTDIEALNRMDGVDILHRSAHRNLDVLIVSAGAMAERCLEAAQILERDGLGVTVADPRWIIPVNPFLPHLVARHRLAITVEDGLRVGGMGSLLQSECLSRGVETRVVTLGLDQAFLPHGGRDEILGEAGLNAQRISDAALQHISATLSGGAA